jgi:hypothetical protein
MEAVLALALGLLVLGAIVTISQAIRKMSHMGDLAGTLQEAAIAMAYMEKDLTQAVQKPDPKFDSPVILGADRFQLLRAVPKPDGSIGGQLVVYRVVASTGGNFRLRRQFVKDEQNIPGLFRAVRFAQLRGPGGPFVRVTLRMMSHDTAESTGKGSEEAVLTGLVRVMGPEMVSSRALSFGFMGSLNAIDFLQ